MSLKTWKKEFYPTPANKTTKKNAVAHSLRKWIGLLPENRKKHNMIFDPGSSYYDICEKNKDDSYSNNFFSIDDTSCALCHHYIYEDCKNCPLYKVVGTACNNHENKKTPYEIYTETGNPKPMIAALKKAQLLEKKGK